MPASKSPKSHSFRWWIGGLLFASTVINGTGAALGTIIASELVGHFSDARRATSTHAFDPIIVIAGLIPMLGVALVLALVRNTRATGEGLVRRI